MLRPGEWVGVPLGVPDLMLHLAPFRYVLASLVVAAAWLYARERPRAAATVTAAFAACAVGFWIVSLGRPYGLFVDVDATRRAAELSVMAQSGRLNESFLVGEPPGSGVSAWAARALSWETLLVLPSWLPVLIVPLTALAVGRLGRPNGASAALLWLAFATGDLDTVRGAGFVPGLWSHPVSAIGVTLLLLVLATMRPWIGARPVFWMAAAAALVVAWAGMPVEGATLRGIDALLLMTLDQGVWLVLGAIGLQAAIPPVRALVAAGAVLLLASGLGASLDVWGAHALYRAGLLLAALGPLRTVATTLGEWLLSWRALGSGRSATAVGAGMLLVSAASASTLAWWDPLRWDPVARDSTEPLSIGVAEPMDWIRRETPADAVFLASAEYAPSVAVLGGRRVLRAPSLHVAPDDERRRRLERMVLTGTAAPAAALLERYGLRYVLAVPGDFSDLGIAAPHELEQRSHLRLRHASREGFRIYEILGR